MSSDWDAGNCATVDSPPTGASSRGDRDELKLAPGQIVGRFRLLHPLGKGGMGVVYAAHDPNLDRRVALKFVRSRSGKAARRRHERMLREAQAMARLSHPNVVEVLDVGVFDPPGPGPSNIDGRAIAFIAMEYVDAEPLSAWLRHEHEPQEIISVFVAAGRGLAAAHAAGLVHRDFKPDNVLVSAPTAGRTKLDVRVTDFGLARSLRSAASPDASAVPESDASASGLRDMVAAKLTRTGAAAGTPAYMAPEQHRRERVDARADQFAFCVALYEALYGMAPFAGSDPEHRARKVLQGAVRPPPGGTKVPAAVWPVLRRGLHNRPDDRWGSMEHLLDALDKAPRRRRRVWVWSVIGTFGLGSLGAAVIWGRTADARCSGADASLAGAWTDERRQAVKQAVLATSAFYAEDTWERLDRQLDAYALQWTETYRRVCNPQRPITKIEKRHDQAMACLSDARDRFAALVEVMTQADRQVVTTAVRAVAGLPRVERCADTNMGQADASMPDDPQRQKRVRGVMAQLATADAYGMLGKHAEEVDLLERALIEAEAIDHAPTTAEVLTRLGEGRLAAGQVDDAASVLERAYFAAQQAEHFEMALRAAVSLASLEGAVRMNREQGLEWARHAEAALARLDHPRRYEARLLSTFGQIHFQHREYAESLDYHRRAFEIETTERGPDDYYTGSQHNNLGAVLFQQGDVDAAAQHFTKALNIYERALGETHPTIGVISSNLGSLLRQQGDLEAARRHLDRAASILERALGPEHPNLASALNNGFLVYQDLGRYEEATERIERALSILERTRGESHPDVAVVLANMGRLYLRRGQPQQAQAASRRAVAIYERALGNDHPEMAGPLTTIAESHVELGEPQQALSLLERALDVVTGEPYDPEADASAKFVLARALWDLGEQPERARALANEALALYGQSTTHELDRSDEIRRWLQDRAPSKR